MLDFRQYNPDMSQDDLAVVSNDNFNRLQTYTDNLVPAATVTLTAASAAPTGWLLCDGAAVSRARYKTLFASIGTTYGVGDGSTTFNLPNLKGRVPVGLDSSQTEFDVLGETGGNKNMQQHNHGITDPGHVHGMYSTYNGAGTANRTNLATGTLVSYSNPNTNSATTGITVNNAGTGNSQNLQPYLVMNYIIKT